MGGDAHQGLLNNPVRQKNVGEALQVANQNDKLAGISERLNLQNRVSTALKTVEFSEIVTALDLQDVVIKHGFFNENFIFLSFTLFLYTSTFHK